MAKRELAAYVAKFFDYCILPFLPDAEKRPQHRSLHQETLGMTPLNRHLMLSAKLYLSEIVKPKRSIQWNNISPVLSRGRRYVGGITHDHQKFVVTHTSAVFRWEILVGEPKSRLVGMDQRELGATAISS
jgi:hypothetical protein